MAYVRRERDLMLHGAAASRMLDVGAGGAALSACVTILDGLVYARSAFHHSVNYRSVVVFGRAREVTALAEKRASLDDPEDLVVPVWTGQLPVGLRAMSHIPTPDDSPRFALPARSRGID